MTWRDDALCAQDENIPYRDVFHGEEPRDIARAKLICSRCPVSGWCERAGLRELENLSPDLRPMDIGVWGGLTGRELAELAQVEDRPEGDGAVALKRDKGIGMLLRGIAPRNVARALGVSTNTVYGWQRAMQAAQTAVVA